MNMHDNPDNLYMMALSHGFSVYVPHLVLDDDERTIVAMHSIGPEQAINANWAAIVNGGASNSIYYTTIKLSGMKQHFRLKGTLPCGWTENWLCHNQISITNMDVGHEFFYVLNEGHDEETYIARFSVMLDKALSIPVLPAWKDFLWQEGINDDLITEVSTYDCINLGAWKVERNTERWQHTISWGLNAGEISF